VLRRALLIVIVLGAAAAAAVYWFFSGDGMRRSLEHQASRWLGQPVRIASATASLFPRVAINLRDVRVGEPVHLSLAAVEVSTGLRPLLSRRVEDAEIIVSDSRVDMPLRFSLPGPDAPAGEDTGPGDSAPGDTAPRDTAPKDAAPGITVASVRTITLRDIRIVSRGREIVISAESSLNGSRLDVSRFTARAGRTSLDASGVVELAPAVNANLHASADELDLDDLLALTDAFTTPSAPARTAATRSSPRRSRAKAGPAGRITAKLSARRGRAAGVELTNLGTTVRADGNRVMLSPAVFELFGGRYDGALDVDLRENLALTLTTRIENLDVARLAAFGGVPGSVSGRLSGHGKFTARGADMAALLGAAAGNGSASIVDGTVQRLNLVRTVILFFGRPAADAPAAPGDRFDRMTASFSLARRILNAESFTMNSPDVDIAGSGTLAIATKALDGRTELLLSESLSSQAGTDLIRYTREGTRVLLPATIGGTVDAPRVMIDAAAAVKRGIRNEAERRLKSLFERLKPPQ
jgi:uncharacterized protein involved in outer membrane biogenesis